MRLTVFAILLCMLLSVSHTIAYLQDTTEETNNIFSPAKTDIQIKELFDGTVKTNVRVEVPGESAAAYIRVKAVPGWYHADETLAAVPVDGTYDAVIGDGWVLHDGYYYYTQKVDGGESTRNLFASVQPKSADMLGEAYDALRFHFDILADAVQAEGTEDSSGKSIVEEAWGVDPSKL